MMVRWLVFLIFSADVCTGSKSTEASEMNWNFNQSDYDFKMERMAVLRYDHTYFRNFTAAFVPYNRTQRVINASFDILIDILPKTAKVDIQVYKFRSNEYRFFPITVQANPCVEYERNSFHVQEMFNKTSNFRGCPARRSAEMNWDFNQNDYDFKMERMEVLSYDQAYFRNVKAAFVPYNRTQRVINASFDILIDILLKTAKVDIQVYKFRSNEYRFFPITLQANPCAEYARNSFHLQELFNKSSNFRGCPARRSTEASGMNWDFSQNDYDFKMERMEVLRYDHTYFRNVKAAFVPYNRTQRVINASFDVLIDVLQKTAKVDIQVYKFRSNEYRFFPITLQANPCVEYERNSFHLQELFNKTSNFRGCPLRRGFYEMINGLPDFTKFPPLIPYGQYKMSLNFTYKAEVRIEVEFYGSVIEKPTTWQK